MLKKIWVQNSNRPLVFLALVLLASCEMPKHTPFVANLKELAIQLSGKNSQNIRTNEDALKALSDLPFTKSPALNRWTVQFNDSLRQSREIWGYVMEDRKSREPLYCIDQCACIWDRFSKALLKKRGNQESPQYYSLYMVGPGSLEVGVRYEKNIAWYHHHYSQILKLDDGSWSVFDPIVFGDGNLHSVKDFLDRLVRPETLKITAVRK